MIAEKHIEELKEMFQFIDEKIKADNVYFMFYTPKERITVPEDSPIYRFIQEINEINGEFVTIGKIDSTGHSPKTDINDRIDKSLIIEGIRYIFADKDIYSPDYMLNIAGNTAEVGTFYLEPSKIREYKAITERDYKNLLKYLQISENTISLKYIPNPDGITVVKIQDMGK